MEKALLDSVNEMCERGVFISGELVKEKGLKLLEIVNAKLSEEKKLSVFLQRMAGKIQSRWGLRSWKSYGESGSANNEAIARELPVLQAYLHNFSLRDIFNADEFGLFWRLCPDRTIAKQQLEGKKVQ